LEIRNREREVKPPLKKARKRGQNRKKRKQKR